LSLEAGSVQETGCWRVFINGDKAGQCENTAELKKKLVTDACTTVIATATNADLLPPLSLFVVSLFVPCGRTPPAPKRAAAAKKGKRYIPSPRSTSHPPLCVYQ